MAVIDRDPIRVLIVLDAAGETSIPLEVAAAIDIPDIEVKVCSFFEPDNATFDVDVTWLGSDSRLDPRAYLRLRNLAAAADVVHVHANVSGALVKLLATTVDAAVVKTEHNTHNDFGRVKRLVNGVTNPLCTLVVANSKTTRRSFARWERLLLAATGVNVDVIYNGVDVDAIETAREEAPPPPLPDGFSIGTASRLVDQKNHAALLRAAAPLLRERDAHLVVVGDGPLRDPLESLAADLGITSQVQFLGYLERRQDVYGVLDKLDIFAFPSHFEGFGVAVAEAMALGVPVVANDISVLREVIGDAGLLVNVDDTASFGATLRRLCEDHTTREQLATAGAARIRERFPIEKTVREYADCYRELARTVAHDSANSTHQNR